MDAFSLPLPYEYSKYLFCSSFFMGASSFIFLYSLDYMSFFFMFMLFLTSIQFWYKPTIGWKRDLDLFMCKALSLYFFGNTLLFHDDFSHAIYLSGFYSTVFFYIMSHVCYYFKSKKWIIFHMTIHFYTFFTPFALYRL
jgi:hypothetical protein